ncbi:MAG: S41 family peptidase [Bacteroidota bacterium]
MKKQLFFCLSLLGLFSCNKEDFPEISNPQVFQEMWQYIDENYIYFDQKGVDWNEVRKDYEPLINERLEEEELLDICFEMLNLLKDGHNRLTTNDFDENYDYKIGYEIHFDLSVVKQNYLDNDFQESAFYTYGILQDSIAYAHFSSFKQVDKIQEVMNFFSTQPIKGMIFDIRDNTGGDGQDAVEIVGHFIEQPRVVGYLVEKTGRAHDDISMPLSVQAIPKSPFIDVPIALLTNRKSYSASTYLASQLKDLPNVTLVGQITGGGGGGNQTQELSNTWLLTISSSKFLDIHFDESIEEGVVPDVTITNDSLTLTKGIDEMLEKAIGIF